MRSNPSKKFFGHYMLNSPNWRSQDFVLRGPENRGAIAAEFETPSGDVECPPQPTRGSGERRKLPQRSPGQSPGRKRILVHFELEKKRI